jgi:serine/threonine-protein kinase
VPDALDRLKVALADRYLIERELGAGGMATVYLAQDLKHQREVAIKVLRPELTAALGTERFLREITTTANLHHPHILSLYDSGEADGFLYYVMPHVEGESLRDRLDREKQLPVDDALQIAREVADALSYAHIRGVIHRDIKPENILLESGHAVVADFGIGMAFGDSSPGRLTRTGIALGTPAYMSPEQAGGGGTVDGRTDVYAVGCVLYEMLAGVPPFGGPTARAILARHAVDPVPSLRTVRPTVPAELEGVVMKALAKVPADRFPEMPALLTSLQAITARAASPEAPMPAVPATGTPAIAVLPFTNMSADPDQEYFCDGMAEEILSALGRVGGLRVIARTASFSFKDTQRDVRDIGRSLHVDMVLEGSVRKAGRQLRITAQLVKVPEGVHLWSDRYDREMEDVFAIQDDISRSIITALRVKLGMEQAAPLVKRPTANLQAYDAYLRGIHSFNKRSRPANEKAIDLLEHATTLDPAFALGLAALAGAYIEHFFTHEPKDEWEEKAFVAIEKARTLDPELAEIYVAKGNLLWTRSRHFLHREAIAEYQRALAINPDLAEAHTELARVYWHIGLLDPAYEALERAMEINPAFVDGKFRLAWLEMHRGNYERALSLFRAIPKLSLAPSVDVLTAMTLHYLGRGAEARARLDEVDERYRHGCDFTSVEAIFLALDGDAQAARDMIQLALTDGQDLGHFHHVTNNVAVAYAVMNDTTRAMQWLETTAHDGFPCYPWFERDPCLENLRGDARFEAFLSRLKNQWQVPEGEGP